MRLALDHHYSPQIAERLRERGHDVVAAVEVGWHAEEDESLLTCCYEDRRALLSNNVADFVVIARRWLAEGCSHHGLIFTSDHSMPRTRGNIGAYVEALGRLLEANAGDDAFVDRIHWL